MEIFSKVQKVYQVGGLPLVGKCITKRVFKTNSAWWFARDLSEPLRQYPFPQQPSPQQPFTQQLEIKKNKFDEVLQYMRVKDYVTDDEISVALSMKHWFLGLVSEEGIRGFCKVGFKEVYINDFQEVIRLPDNLAFIYEYEIDESLRGRGIGRFFITNALQLIASEGYRYVSCHVPPWNIASIKVIEQCGFKKVDFIRFVKIGGIKIMPKKISTLFNDIINNNFS